MDMAQPKRKSRLSAYYNLPSRETDTNPLPTTRAEALTHAKSLTETLSLTELLTHATQQTNHAAHLRAQLHHATNAYYTQLSLAQAAAEQASAIAARLPDATSRTTDVVALVAQVTDRLAPSRSSVAAHDGARKANLLRCAASLLRDALRQAAVELPLCTDPASTRDSLLLAAHRCAAIRPALVALAASPKPLGLPFKEAMLRLEESAREVCHALREEQSVLDLSDTARVRLLLEDDRVDVQADFVRAVVAGAAATRIREDALRGLSGASRAARRISLFAKEAYSKILQAGRNYNAVFGGEKKVQWVDDVVEEMLAEAHSEINGVLGDAEGMRKLREAEAQLRASGAIIAADKISEAAETAAQLEARDLWQSALRDVLDNRLDATHVFNKLDELPVLLNGVSTWDADSGLRAMVTEAAASVTGDTNVEAGRAARAAAICTLASRRAGGSEVEAAREATTTGAIVGACDAALGELTGKAKVESQGGVDAVRETAEVGARHEIRGLTCVQADVLDEGGLSERIEVTCVQAVRREAWDEEQVAHMRAALRRLGGVLGDGFGERVLAAIEDRCL